MHQTDALQVVQCAAGTAIKHVTAAVHMGSVESNFPPVILQNAVDELAIDEVLVIEFHRIAAEDFALR